MGASLGITVSTLIPEEKWVAVYDEALSLAQKLNLAEQRVVEIHGLRINCLAVTEEGEQNGTAGWRALADYETTDGVDEFFFPRKLDKPESDKPADVLVSQARDIGVIQAPNISRNYEQIWGCETNEHEYHMSLLAVGCLVQDRLGDDALVDGAINAGQCRAAVKLANEYLDQPISVPYQCDLERWGQRIDRVNLKGTDRIKVAVDMYLGRTDAAFGEKLRTLLPDEQMQAYWKARFTEVSVFQMGFQVALKQYLNMGFDMGVLYELVSLEKKEEIEKCVRLILETKMHWKEKDLTDYLDQDPEDPTLYGTSKIMAQIVFFWGKNRKVDRYIPVEDLRDILNAGFGKRCDVDGIVDDYLRMEQSEPKTPEEKVERDVSASFTGKMQMILGELDKLHEEYDIIYENQLQFYKAGDRILPDIKVKLKAMMDVTGRYLKGREWEKFPHDTVWEMERSLSLVASEYLYLRDRDWERMFNAVEENPDNFKRYFSLLMFTPEYEWLRFMVIALIINDELYEYARNITFNGK